MFIVVIAVPDDAPASQTSITADPNGASSVLVMLDGAFDPADSVYQNRAQLFLVRLLDTTQVAIDVGRERMGTDKRPGTIDMTRNGRRLRMSIKDRARTWRGEGRPGAGRRPRGVHARGRKSGSDRWNFRSGRSRAAPNTPTPRLRASVRGRVVSWQWRSDLVPRLQPVIPGAVVFDSSSEEGRMLLTWGFTPKVLGYFPNVRGSDHGPRGSYATPVRRRRPDRHQQFTNGRPTMRARGFSSALNVLIHQTLRAQGENVRLIRTAISGEPVGNVGQLPVLRLLAQELSSSRSAGQDPGVRRAPSVGAGATSSQPRWAWDTTFLGSLTAILRKEVVGVTPDGLRINWHVTTGSFIGPGLDAIVLPGAADWMRIRRDGVGDRQRAGVFRDTGRRTRLRFVRRHLRPRP